MKIFTAIFLALVLLSGCKPRHVEDTKWRVEQDRIAYAYSAVIPLPETTLFDTDPRARTAYLSAYQDGYRSGLTELNMEFGRPREGFSSYSYVSARTQGWKAGSLAGFNISMQGIPGSTNSLPQGK